jgi:hypothetical protein
MTQIGSQLRTELGASATRTVAGSAAGGGQVVSLSLTFAGVAFVPTDLFDALEAKYGANKVVNDADTGRHGVYRWRILP